MARRNAKERGAVLPPPPDYPRNWAVAAPGAGRVQLFRSVKAAIRSK